MQCNEHRECKRARLFILTIPGCLSRISENTFEGRNYYIHGKYCERTK